MMEQLNIFDEPPQLTDILDHLNVDWRPSTGKGYCAISYGMDIYVDGKRVGNIAYDSERESYSEFWKVRGLWSGVSFRLPPERLQAVVPRTVEKHMILVREKKQF